MLLGLFVNLQSAKTVKLSISLLFIHKTHHIELLAHLVFLELHVVIPGFKEDALL
jgi:hypothetical protein